MFGRSAPNFFHLIFLAMICASATWVPAQDATPSADSPGESHSIRQQAEAARQEGRLWEAVGLFEKAIVEDPKWVEAWWALGTLYYELDHFPEALEAFKQVLFEKPETPGAWALLGLCQYQVGDYDKAAQNLAVAEAQGIGDNNQFAFVVRYRRALLLAKFGEFEISNRVLSDLAALGHSDKPTIREALGISALRLSYLPKELPGSRREQVLLTGRALSYMMKNLPEEANFAFQELVRRFPEEPNVHYTLGNFLAQTQPEKALEAYLKELELSPEHLPALIEVSFEYLRRGEPQAALPYAEKAVSVEPENFVAHLAVGRALLETSDTDKALEELERAAELAPESPEVQFALGRVYRKLGRAEDAEKANLEFERLRELRERRSKPSGTPEQKPPGTPDSSG